MEHIRAVFTAHARRNRENRRYIRETWPTLRLRDRVWALVGSAGGGCLIASAVLAAVFKDHTLALIFLGLAVTIALLIAIRAISGAYLSRDSN